MPLARRETQCSIEQKNFAYIRSHHGMIVLALEALSQMLSCAKKRKIEVTVNLLSLHPTKKHTKKKRAVSLLSISSGKSHEWVCSRSHLGIKGARSGRNLSDPVLRENTHTRVTEWGGACACTWVIGGKRNTHTHSFINTHPRRISKQKHMGFIQQLLLFRYIHGGK